MTRLFTRRIGIVLLLLTMAMGASVLPAAAVQPEEETPEEDSDEDAPVVDIDLDSVVDAIDDLISEFGEFAGNWDATLEEVLIAVMFQPFRTLATQIVQVIASLLTTTPAVHPNPAVEEIHRDALLVAWLMSGIGFMVAGVLHITGPIFGVSYQQVRMMLPRIIAGLIFGSVSLPLLQYGVDLSNAMVQVFKPGQLTMSIQQLAGLSVSLVLVWVVQSVLLLVLVVIFLIRDVYILFVAAISPLIALAWSMPHTKRYADTFIAGWFTALAMAPLDMIVLRFNLALLQGSGGTAVQGVSNWMYGVAGFTFLIFVPYQLYGASQAAIGQAYMLSQGAKHRYHEYRNRSESRDQQRPSERRRSQRQQNKYRSEKEDWR